ncbi:CHP1784-containing protein [Calothrix sp. NIES-4071]|nr:CHP1784-containing protein [Calothrix sp. NIES-4071]BAZ60100.1 CHP1784-containing protein [Calothrix sp. NIES-4105]
MFKRSDLRKTTFYQEVKEEIQEELEQKVKRRVEKRFRQEFQQKAKIESIPRLLAFGLTPEQIAYALDLDVKVVKMTVLNNYMVIS